MSKASLGQKSKSSVVTLKGSAQLVSDFFYYGINSILYQRGIYPPESFTRKQEYGLTLLVSDDKRIQDYLNEVISQIKQWLEDRKVKRLVVVLTNVDTKETLERWEFNVEYEKSEEGQEQREGNFKNVSDKEERIIKKEISDVIRQITASVTFLPLLDCVCSFDILIYTHRDLEIPTAFSESAPYLIENAEEIQLKSFSTGIHKVDTAVSYKLEKI